MEVVLPIPGAPDRIKFGKFPSIEMFAKRATVSWFPTISFKVIGLYFSTQGTALTNGSLIVTSPIISFLGSMDLVAKYNLKNKFQKDATFQHYIKDLPGVQSCTKNSTFVDSVYEPLKGRVEISNLHSDTLVYFGLSRGAVPSFDASVFGSVQSAPVVNNERNAAIPTGTAAISTGNSLISTGNAPDAPVVAPPAPNFIKLSFRPTTVVEQEKKKKKKKTKRHKDDEILVVD